MSFEATHELLERSLQAKAKVKLSRSLGIALTPKAAKYMERRPYPPGQHGRGRKKESDYKNQLVEKQRLRAQYNVSERQLRNLYAEATRRPGKTGEILVGLLESRLDAFVLRAGFARTIYQARQFVNHGHFTVNGRKVDIASYRLKAGDFVQVRKKSRETTPFQLAAAGAWAGETTPAYIEAHLEGLIARFLSVPERKQIPVICDEQLIVEYYSK
ncbi:MULTISPECIES: 30S ribosomal protein S4 [Glycomyces]|jgi:small subunit ribosomal protein S4|uniref:Small ribosomal subunit protein uS4 n=2 Tax=Glycomyces lechevalierae TaxID=256034 RepID=A0A9X3SVI0_9ACTN|nr:30S ribosomal protein S4 [Glycomyces lechevalierae]MDA1384797.1 30S ribosomal protein S4 [Glycomyces lechevalierae]